MYKIKQLSPEGIPAALEKAERYRLLNEPSLAESICLDVLATDPENQKAIVMLILALTDRFGRGFSVSDLQVQNLIDKLQSQYEQIYYSGLIHERRGKAALNQGNPGAHSFAYQCLTRAMEKYEEAEKIRRPGNDDAILRWNTCARIIIQNKLAAHTPNDSDPGLE
jgi:hypothetical protein